MNKTRGVVYFCQGNLFYREAVISAKSFIKYHPGIPVVLITPDVILKKGPFSTIIKIPDLGNPFKTKVNALANSPFDFTLYLDSDTIVCSPVFELFDFLLTYDIAVANRVKCIWGSETIFVDYIDRHAYNTGVLAYSNSEVNKIFFKKWVDIVMCEDSTIMKSGYLCDQHYFNELIFKNNLLEKLNIKLVEIPNKKYNARPHLVKQLKMDKQYCEIKIQHWHFGIDTISQIKRKVRSFLHGW